MAPSVDETLPDFRHTKSNEHICLLVLSLPNKVWGTTGSVQTRVPIVIEDFALGLLLSGGAFVEPGDKTEFAFFVPPVKMPLKSLEVHLRFLRVGRPVACSKARPNWFVGFTCGQFFLVRYLAIQAAALAA